MSKQVTTQHGTIVRLIKPLTRPTGEGQVWITTLPQTVAKVYHRPTQKRADKLLAMIASPPDEPSGQSHHHSFAWPTDVIYDGNKFVGFLMPMIGGHDFQEALSPRGRAQSFPSFTWKSLHVTAANLASVFGALHEADYVIGDVKHENFKIDRSGFVSVLDNDSFRVTTAATTFPCSAWTPGYTPSETLANLNAPRSIHHDLFGLGVLVHQLLLGRTPFQGSWQGRVPKPDENGLIQGGHSPYRPASLLVWSPYVVPVDVVGPNVMDLFRRTFDDGHASPSLRAEAREWRDVLQEAAAALIQCRRGHYYHPSASHCLWCAYTKLHRQLGPRPRVQQRSAGFTIARSLGNVGTTTTPSVVPYPGFARTGQGTSGVLLRRIAAILFITVSLLVFVSGLASTGIFDGKNSWQAGIPTAPEEDGMPLSPDSSLGHCEADSSAPDTRRESGTNPRDGDSSQIIAVRALESAITAAREIHDAEPLYRQNRAEYEQFRGTELLEAEAEKARSRAAELDERISVQLQTYYQSILTLARHDKADREKLLGEVARGELAGRDMALALFRGLIETHINECPTSEEGFKAVEADWRNRIASITIR